MPSALLYLGIMLGVIGIWFMIFKRPMYEALLISFVVLLTITGTWGNVWEYIDGALSTSLLYSMIAFIAMSIVMTKTKVIDGCIAIVLALLGRIPGGAGYVSVATSAFMGALSGSGPGNVMATGTITIPAMIKSGFPRELAANIESNASCMGNMIPPSSNIVAAMGAFAILYPNSEVTSSQFWIVLWSIALWFVIQRFLLVWIFCKRYNVKPLAKEDLPNLKEVFKSNWQALLLPVIILFPFVLDYLFKDGFFTARLGAQGAKYMSSSMLMFIPGIAAIYTCLIGKDKKQVSLNALADMFAKGIKSIAPVVSVCVVSYMVGGLFSDMDVAGEIGEFIISLNFNKFVMVLFMCLLTCFLGMVIVGSSQIVIFGPVFISVLVSVGIHPVLAAAMLPCICGVMAGITPPMGLCMYAGMSIAESDFGKTFKNNLWWVASHFLMEVVVLMGWLPILGL